MHDDQKIMKIGLIIAALVILVRIVIEQAGAPFAAAGIFGVVWLYFVLPILFALAIRNRADAKPYRRLLKDVFLFAVYTRVMVALTYVLAYFLQWPTPRFSAAQGGTVGPEIEAWRAILYVPARNALFWIAIAVIVGMMTGSVTLLIKRKKLASAQSYNC
jgi:hypothetical protein